MRRRPLVYSLGALLLASLSLASAQNAFTSRPINVHAGPDREYPLVAQLDEGAPLYVHGCLDDWTWCDVSFDDNRGWVYSEGLSFVYEGERVPLYSYGPSLGLPIVVFSVSTYWGNYYRGRPWYAQRDQWEHRRFPPHQRPHEKQFTGPPPIHGRSAPGGHRGHAAPAPRSHAAPSERSHARPPERSHAAPSERSHAAPSRRPHAAPPERPHAAPPSMSHGRPSAGGHPQPRATEHGHTNRPAQKRPPPHEEGRPPLGG